MAKLSSKQLREVRRQAKEAREKAIQESGEPAPETSKDKKDKKGFTREDRQTIRDIKSNLEKSAPKISWNYENGELVYLPDNTIGMIVQTNAKDLPASYFEADMKKTMKNNKYTGKIFVVTTSGNQWYYPNQLKKVRE